jgi:hypothetical protein
MTKSKWKLTPEGDVDERGEEPRRLDRRKASPLELLAEDPLNGLVELGPGVYLGPKAP